MIKLLTRYFASKAGLTDKRRVKAINDYLLYENMPNLERGVLYLEGAGTASAYVAQRAAQIFLTGAFNTVVFTGAKIPARDPILRYVRDRLIADGMALPAEGVSEAVLMARDFFNYIGKNPEDKSVQGLTRFIILDKGLNTGEKVRSLIPHWDGQAPIQGVTLSYEQRRLLGTMRKELGRELGKDPIIAVDGVYPMGYSKDNWHLDPLAYIKVMDEADKTGPRFDGKQPTYSRLGYFDEIDVEAERKRVQFTLG